MEGRPKESRPNRYVRQIKHLEKLMGEHDSKWRKKYNHILSQRNDLHRMLQESLNETQRLQKCIDRAKKELNDS